MPPRKSQPSPAVPQVPGPTRLEVRVNDKIVFLQRVYGYTIDQETDSFAVYGTLKPEAVEVPAEPEPAGDDAA